MSNEQHVQSLVKICERLSKATDVAGSDDLPKLFASLGELLANQQHELQTLQAQVRRLESRVEEIIHPHMVI